VRLGLGLTVRYSAVGVGVNSALVRVGRAMERAYHGEKRGEERGRRARKGGEDGSRDTGRMARGM